MPNHTIEEILAASQKPRSRLTSLLRRAQQRASWTEQLRAVLPKTNAEHYVVANIRDHLLTIHATSASWATRLRFLVPEVLQSLSQLQDFSQVEEIRVRATLQEELPLISEDQGRGSLGTPLADVLLDLAEDTDHTELKKAILKLAAHGTERQKTPRS